MKHNPTIKDRTIYQALGHAEQNRFELHKYMVYKVKIGSLTRTRGAL